MTFLEILGIAFIVQVTCCVGLVVFMWVVRHPQQGGKEDKLK